MNENQDTIIDKASYQYGQLHGDMYANPEMCIWLLFLLFRLEI
jgi:hypothetical protein